MGCWLRFSAKFLFFVIIIIGICAVPGICSADDERTQYPGLLLDSYIGLNIGYIDYKFSEIQLGSGYTAGQILIPRPAVQLSLGHNFDDYLSAQMTYIRPVKWVRYADVRNSKGVNSSHSVFANIVGLTVRGQVPINGQFSVYAESGLGVVTRSGFEIDNEYVVADANYASLIVGGGFKYKFNRAWDLQGSTIYLPPRKSFQQSHILMTSGGVVFNMRSIPPEKVRINARLGNLFPVNLIQIGYTTDNFGTGVNRFVSGKVPIFWGGDARVGQGIMLLYQRNIFHTKNLFSFDFGVSGTRFRDVQNKRTFSTISVFPQFKFTPIRSSSADFYLSYSLAGPTYISRIFVDGIDTGSHFTFQDLMGLGGYIGRQKNINAEVRIGHYSSGNIFPRNPGIQIPLTFNIGYAF